ncbi:sorting nexin-20 isoform X1 [Pipistrellus kuhlii]|uniref:sorting nexin-20 isoform X1 n=1 Tax=Pipistrellus kuhlii TaxID=59472 RepID=UPI00174F3AC5|nr:sorting nexin-20 isoform X1 [Pipistrellus kuhlii]
MGSAGGAQGRADARLAPFLGGRGRGSHSSSGSPVAHPRQTRPPPRPGPACTGPVLGRGAVLAAAAGTGSPGAHSGMTTRELQEYWRGEKGDRKPVRLIFDIASARIEEGTPCRFVMYQVVVIQTGSYDSTKAVLERRYSDFEALQRGLLRAFPEEMEDVAFPGKRLLGNLAPALIAARSRALAEYLRQLAGLRCARRSRELLDFLTRPELREAFGCLRAGQYARALGALGRAGPLQARLTAHRPAAAAPALCAALLCLRELERPLEAFAAGERALARLRDGHRYLEPLLDAMVRLARALGRDCAPLQRRLEDCQLRRPGPRGLTLKELAVREYLD